MAYQTEVGHADNPLIVSWLQGRQLVGPSSKLSSEDSTSASAATPVIDLTGSEDRQVRVCESLLYSHF